jgi:hypothetical protein
MQLSVSPSSDSNLSALLLPGAVAAPAGSGLDTGTSDASALAPALGFEALLGVATVGAPSGDVPPATFPIAIAATVPATPAAWPFVTPRAVNAAMDSATSSVVDIVDGEIVEAEPAPALGTPPTPSPIRSFRGQSECRQICGVERKEETKAVAPAPEFVPVPGAMLSPDGSPVSLEVNVSPVSDPTDAAAGTESTEALSALGQVAGAMAQPSRAFASTLVAGTPKILVGAPVVASAVSAELRRGEITSRPEIVQRETAALDAGQSTEPAKSKNTPLLAAPAIVAEEIPASSTVLQPAQEEPRVYAARVEAPRDPEPAKAAAADLVPQLPTSIIPSTGEIANPQSPAIRPFDSVAPIRAENATAVSPPAHAAEFAAQLDVSAVETPRRENVRTRNFVSTSDKQFTSRLGELGTGVAKPADAMPSAPTLPRPSHAAFESASLLVDRAEAWDLAAPQAPVETAVTADGVNTAQRAVEAVLTAVHRFSTSDRHAVNLQFSVGGADLSVRVELRADEVRATFHTDSAELRTALSQEWRAAAANDGERSLRLAPPVFSGNDTAGSAAFSGDQASQQRHPSSARQADEMFSFSTSRTGASAAQSAAPISPRLPLSTALHLHTLA